MDKPRENTEQQLARLTGLYQKDPEEFERQSQELIRQTIERFPEESRRRAYGLQFRIDTALSRCRDPVSRMNKMVELFWEQFLKFQETVCDPLKAVEEKERTGEGAKIIPLPRKDKQH
ncbi:DUF3135 domain-containing protein [Desulfuromonas sp. TF]|uniref:DUF3135 domain-containing protein n=1 Tax=Desulfuromonas sp. TF TaxID=1232410 RepID=UPI0004148F08|nr:DUF3135 domain-containing protein [Desulfuromonas sp. TF]